MFRQTNQHIDGEMTIRRLTADDAGALAQLAQRDSSEVPAGTVYGAITAEGSMLAAISLESRDLVADPFVHTAHAASLLSVWAREVGGATRARWARGGLALVPAEQPAPATSPC